MTSNIEQTKDMVIKALGTVPDFPKPGINFIDILPIFQSPTTFNALLDVLEHMVKEQFGSDGPDVLVGLEARGFLFGPSLALRLGTSFVPVRKQGKMPGKCLSVSYTKEYGQDTFEIQEGAVKPGQKVLIVDDIIATGKQPALFSHPIHRAILALSIVRCSRFLQHPSLLPSEYPTTLRTLQRYLGGALGNTFCDAASHTGLESHSHSR